MIVRLEEEEEEEEEEVDDVKGDELAGGGRVDGGVYV